MSLRRFPFNEWEWASLFSVLPLIGLMLGTIAWAGREAVHNNPKAWALVVAVLFAGWVASRFFFTGKVTVGRDGVATRGSRKLPKFIPFADVEGARLERSVLASADKYIAVVLSMKNGDELRLPRVSRHDDLLAAIVTGLDQFRVREPVDVPAVLENDAEESGYRAPSLPAQILVRVAADPEVDPEVRERAAKKAVAAGEKTAVHEILAETADTAMRKRLKRAL